MLKNDLESLGLNKNEATVYLALHGLGKAKAGEVIKETGLHRNLVYQALEALAGRRLLTKSTTGSVALFSPTDPIHLLDGIREQELSAERIIKELKEKKKIVDQEITVYEGAEGMRSFSFKNAKALKSGEFIYVLGSGGPRFEEAMGERALKKYFDAIAKHGGAKVLMYQPQQYSQKMYTFAQDLPTFEFRVLPVNLTPAAGVVFTGSSVAFHLYEDPIAVIEITNPHLVEAYKNYFDLLWDQRIRILHGEEAFLGAFDEILEIMESGETYRVMGASVGLDAQSHWKDYYDQFHRHRIKMGVRVQMLSYEAAYPGIRQRFIDEGDPELQLSEIKPLRKTQLSPLQVNLIKDRVFLHIYGDEPSVIIIDQKEVFDGFNNYFEELWNRTTETLVGDEGIRDLCELVLSQRKDLYLIAATGSILKSHPTYYKKFTQQRKELGINIHMLANESIRNSAFTKLPASTVTYLPPEFESPMVVWTFGEYVANVLLEEPQKVFLTHNKKTAESYRRYFQRLRATH
jgi:predicted DNA-binding transcriptional regulator